LYANKNNGGECKMNIKYKFITHEVLGDAVFVGATIVADGCKFKCKNCHNKGLKKEKSVTDSAENIIAEIKQNSFNEGIILSGLEWSLQPLELIELCRLASDNELKVAIYTGCELTQFHQRLGMACAKKTGLMVEVEAGIETENDRLVYAYIGSTVLDEYIKDEYYIKTGLYDETKLVDDNTPFGIKLASSNQQIYKIKAVK
jgi:organic radical activating enzyme